MTTPAWHTATTVWSGNSRAMRSSIPSHALVEAVPALPLGREDPIGLRLHVEGPVPGGVLLPLQPVGLTGVDLAQVALPRQDLEPERRGDDVGRLDGTRDDAGEQHVGVHAARLGEMVAKRGGLAAPERRQPGASGGATDHALEPGVRVTVADEDEPHRLTLRVQRPRLHQRMTTLATPSA